jgi:hypothetical protein
MSKRRPPRGWRLVVVVERGRPLRARVERAQADDEEAALALAADAARLAVPLRQLLAAHEKAA